MSEQSPPAPPGAPSDALTKQLAPNAQLAPETGTVPADANGALPEPPQRRSFGSVAERLVLPVLLLGLIVLFATLPATGGSFFTSSNFQTVLSNQAVVGLAALGVIPSIAAGSYDLSIGANVGASTMAAAGAAEAGWSLPAILGMALLVGLTIGIVNGCLVAYLNINSIITTIGTATVIGALVSWYSDGATIIAPFPEALTDAVNGNWLGVPKVVWYLGVVALAVYFLMDHTPLGRYLQALGSNPEAARLVGLNVRVLTVVSLAVTGLIGGVAGIVIAAQNGSVSPQTGPGYTLVAISAVFLGSTCIQPGRFNTLGTVIAVYFVAVIVNGLTLAGAAAWVNPLFNGLALLIAVALSVAVRRRSRG